MAGSLGRLVVDLLLKTGSFESDMGRASKTAKKRMKEIEQSASTAGKVLGTALAAGVGLAAVAIKQAIDQADQLNEISKKIGIPTDVLSGLNYAAKLSGVATEELQAGLVKMVKAQADAAQGGKENAKVFSTLGIAIKDSAGNLRDSASVFGDFSQIFHDLPDGPEKTALALKVFGKAGAELIPLLNEGRSGIRAYTDELSRLGGTVTPATAAAADAFNDNLDKLKVAFGGLALKVAEELLPQMIMLTNSMVDFAKNGDNAAGIAGFIGTQFEGTARSIRATSNEMAVLAKLWNTQGLFGDGILKTLSDAQVQFDTDEAKRSNRSRIGMGRGIRGGKGMGASLPKSTAAVGDLYTPDAPAGAKGKKNIDEVAQAYERMNAQMAETIALFGQTTEVAKVRYDLEHGDLAKLDAAKKSELLQQAASIDLLKEEADEKDKLKKLDDDRLESIKQHKKDIKQLLDDIAFETELTKLNNDERERAIALRHANADAASEEGQQIIAALDALQKARKENGQLIDNLDEFRASFSDNVTDVLTGAKSIGDAFKSLADQIVAQLARIVANRITESLLGPMGSAGGGSQGGILGSLFSAFLGGSSPSGSFGIPMPGSGTLPGFANGTMSAPGGWAMVGERGPEMVNLPRGSKVYPNGKGPRNGSTIVQNINVAENTSRATAAQLAYKAGLAAQTAIARNS